MVAFTKLMKDMGNLFLWMLVTATGACSIMLMTMNRQPKKAKKSQSMAR